MAEDKKELKTTLEVTSDSADDNLARIIEIFDSMDRQLSAVVGKLEKVASLFERIGDASSMGEAAKSVSSASKTLGTVKSNTKAKASPVT